MAQPQPPGLSWSPSVSSGTSGTSRLQVAEIRYSTSTQFLAGQAHSKGPVILSWGATRRGAKSPHRGENVVYHEFAHQLDMLDGITAEAAYQALQPHYNAVDKDLFISFQRGENRRD